MPKSDEENFYTRVWLRCRERWPTRYQKPHEPTQRQIAKMAHVEQASVSKWATGGLPSMTNARDLAVELGVCVDWLYTGRKPKFPTEPFMADPETAALLDLWDEVGSENRERVLDLLRTALGLTQQHKKAAGLALHEPDPTPYATRDRRRDGDRS